MGQRGKAEEIAHKQTEHACLQIVDCMRPPHGAQMPHEAPSEDAMSSPMDAVIDINPFPIQHTTNFTLPECRICQEEDDLSHLEAPCDCSGTLKFAHRECVQRWCNEKGDTVCEICLQPFKQGYYTPQFLHPAESVSLDLSDTWEIELRDPRILALAAAQRRLLESDFEEYSAMDTRSAACCRSIVLILMALLLLRHTTAMSAATDDGDILFFLVILCLRLVGFLLPCYIMVRALHMLRHGQPDQVSAAGGNGLSVVLRGSQPQAIRVAFVPSVDLP